MRIVVIAAALLLFQSIRAIGQDFYDIESVHTIELAFSQPNWDQILDDLYAAGKERLVGTAIIDGVRYDSVGVRYKGSSTYSPNRTKNPLNIKLDHIIDGQKLQGYGTLKLANVWFDPSFVREVLSYEIARNYMPASAANYTNVYINGTLMGLYVNVQDVGKLFTRTHFYSDDGARIEGSTTGDPQTIYTVWGYEGADSTDYMQMYELDSDHGWNDLIDFLDTLNNFTSEVEKVVNVDRHLWMLAFDNLFVNLDAPINYAHNYYLYRDDSRRFNPIIWDLNMNFGGFQQIIGGANLSLSQMQHLSPWLNATNPNYPIINKFLANESYKKRYVAHLKTIMNEMVANDWYRTRALELQSLIDLHVLADPNKFSSYANFLSNINATANRVPGIAELMNARRVYLNTLPQLMAPAPTVSSVTHVPEGLLAGAIGWVSASVSNATLVQLKFRDDPVEPFTAITMLDDGNHGDGVAEDGVYGAAIQAGSSDIHYYLYAENANAATFMPPRAEYEDFVLLVTVPTVSAVVINEFMADNVSTQADQNGEYEDWIELYNPISAPISLAGCHLSDKLTEFGKWTFPDTSIAPFSFMTIWADQDTTQPGLHANFALSKSGETIVLSNPDMLLIDSVLFGAQMADSSMGRCPDGSGPFTRSAPSFAADNCATNCCVGTRGDIMASGIIDLYDLSIIISYLTVSPVPLLPCEDAADVNGVSPIDLSDLALLVTYLSAVPRPTLPPCP